jgi:hypothetical protein
MVIKMILALKESIVILVQHEQTFSQRRIQQKINVI